MRSITPGLKHTPELIGRPVAYGRKRGIVRSIDHTKVYVQFGFVAPLGITTGQLSIACANWDSNSRPCKGLVDPHFAGELCNKCSAEYSAQRQREDYEY